MAEKVPQIDTLSGLLDRLNNEFGEKMPYKLALVPPKDLILAKKNARFMKPETFNALKANIERDGNLSSIPFCFRDKKGKYHVLSGNHRVQAAIQAGIEQILVFYSSNLSKSKQTAIQLSHNAIEGEDNLTTLKELWESIEELDLKIYAGLDSETLGELEKIQFEGLSEQRIDYKSVFFLFLPEEIEKAVHVFEQVHILFKGEDTYIFSLAHWQKFFDLITEIKTTCNVKNSAVAFSFMLDLAAERLLEMRPPDLEASGDQSE